MASFNPPELQARCVEDFGTIPAYAIDGAATPRRIWKLRAQSLAALCAALALLWPLLLRAGSALFTSPAHALRESVSPRRATARCTLQAASCKLPSIRAFARELSGQQVNLKPFYYPALSLITHAVSGMLDNTAMLPTVTPRNQQTSV